jgi:cytoskeletal protein CcmA (bactofilin family)
MFKKDAPMTNGKVDTLIGAGTTIEGKVQANGILRVEGRIGGEVISEGDVIVGEKGEIRANIKARHVSVAGRITGNILASGRMHLMASGSLHGDIEAATIMIEEGAHFLGTCRMKESSSTKSKASKQEPNLSGPSEPAKTGGATTYST